MTQKISVQGIARKLGIEAKPYNINTSELARFKKLLDSNGVDLILDVGANVGQYTRFLRSIGYAGKVVSFEAVSSTYEQLKAVSLNDPLWEIAPQAAIGDRNGEIVINIAGNSESSSILEMLDSHIEAAPESTYVGSETVELCRLDAIAQSYIQNATGAIFLKIDVQGLEKEVIQGASEILPLIKGIQLELSLVSLYKGEILYQEAIAMLQDLGYELHSFITSNSFVDHETGRLLQVDGVFFKA